MAVEALLSRLEKVKQTRPGQWIARCCAHEDRSPSLAIKETEDGTVLVKCFAGCSVEDILGAVGLEITELFPPTDKREWVAQEKSVKFGGIRFSAIDALRCLSGEGSVLLLLACDMAEGKVLKEAERDRLVTAVGRINSAIDYLGENAIEKLTIL